MLINDKNEQISNSAVSSILSCSGCLTLLDDAGVSLSTSALESLDAFVSLITQWNQIASLVSQKDVERLVENHIVDSLSLVSAMASKRLGDAALLDIGSGAGFPAVPLKLALPDLHVVLVERSERKVGFLRKVVGDLGLSNVTIFHGEFPRIPLDVQANAITARAVEKPKKLVRDILRAMPVGSVFLCQSSEPLTLNQGLFHVEHIDDEWRKRGLRRGELSLITRRA